MKIKVYNQNGKVKVTKTMVHKELVLASDLLDGEMMEIEIDVTPSTTAKKRKIKGQVDGQMIMEDQPDKSFINAITVLRFAKDNQCFVEANVVDKALEILKGEQYMIGDTAVFFAPAISILQYAANTDVSLTSEEARKAIDVLLRGRLEEQ